MDAIGNEILANLVNQCTLNHHEDTRASNTGSSLIVTNVHNEVFDDPATTKRFETLFYEIDSGTAFLYLKSFRRVRVQMTTDSNADQARLSLHGTNICGQTIKCYFAQPIIMKNGSTSPHLHPPVPEKQFLISPPASPPVGWEPVREGEPVINYDLLAAMANLVPGEAHELHAQTDKQPGIVVHVCDDLAGYGSITLAQTRRPQQP